MAFKPHEPLMEILHGLLMIFPMSPCVPAALMGKDPIPTLQGVLPWLLLCLLGLLVTGGCAPGPWPPPDLQRTLAEGVAFTDLADEPEAYKGRLVLMGGRVLAAHPVTYGIRLEVLHLPLDKNGRPVEDLSRSEGRFVVAYAGDQEFAFGPGRLVSVVGHVAGAIMENGDPYPLVGAKALRIWPSEDMARLKSPQVLWELTHPSGRSGFP